MTFGKLFNSPFYLLDGENNTYLSHGHCVIRINEINEKYRTVPGTEQIICNRVPRVHLAVFGDVSDGHTWGRVEEDECYWYLVDRGQETKNYLVQNASSAMAGKPYSVIKLPVSHLDIFFV